MWSRPRDSKKNDFPIEIINKVTNYLLKYYIDLPENDHETFIEDIMALITEQAERATAIAKRNQGTPSFDIKYANANWSTKNFSFANVLECAGTSVGEFVAFFWLHVTPEAMIEKNQNGKTIQSIDLVEQPESRMKI